MKTDILKEKIDYYNYHFDGIMSNSKSSIPIGNGKLGANIWIEKNSVLLLLSKNDNWSEQYRLLKTSLIKFDFDNIIFDDNTRTELSLFDGILYINNDINKFSIEILVDACSPIYRISICSNHNFFGAISIVNYRNEEKTIFNDNHSSYHMMDCPHEMKESADILYSTENGFGNFHFNKSSIYDETLSLQGLENFNDKDDIILNRTFGSYITSDQIVIDTKNHFATFKDVSELKCNITTLTQCETSKEDWIDEITCLSMQNKDFIKQNHIQYWNDIWKKSYIFASGTEEAEECTKGYLYQRYMNICAGRDIYPIKFNGSIFTMEPVEDKGILDYDYRMWGAPYWFQNTRLIYWNILYSGDFDLMKSFFNLYSNNLGIFKYMTKEYYGHRGISIPETITVFGTYANTDYGWNRENCHKNKVQSKYIRWYNSGALELAFMMLTYFQFTNDLDFYENKIIPFIKNILEYYLYHFEIIEGKLIIKPTSSLETWQDCVNDTPSIAGLQAVIELLNSIGITDLHLKQICQKISSALPSIPVENVNNTKILMPCEIKSDKIRRNYENPELYTIFPYQIYKLGKENLDLAINTFNARAEKGNFGWSQDCIQAAFLGLREEACDTVHNYFKKRSEEFPFIAFWGPNYDWTPDQDHGNVASIALTQMLMQNDINNLYILPSWNKNWDIEFRLPIMNNNWINCQYSKGKGISYKFDKTPKQKINECINSINKTL